MCVCVSLGFPPHPLNGIKFTMELGQIYCAVPSFSCMKCSRAQSSKLKSAYCSRTRCISAARMPVVSMPLSSRAIFITQDHLMHPPIPNRVTHPGLCTSCAVDLLCCGPPVLWTSCADIHFVSVQSILLERSVAAALVKYPHNCCRDLGPDTGGVTDTKKKINMQGR